LVAGRGQARLSSDVAGRERTLLPVLVIASFACKEPPPPPQAGAPDAAAIAASSVDASIPDAAATAAAEETTPWIEGEVAPGESLIEILGREGLTPEAASEVVRAIGDRMDMRLLRAGQGYRLRFDGDGRVAELELRLSRQSTVRVLRGEGGALAAQRLDAEIRVEEIAIGGTIESSLYASIKETGEETALVAFFVDVFAYDLDFYVDTHRGDSFKMIVEKEYVGGELLRYGKVLAAEYSGRAGTFRAFYWQPPGEPHGRYFDDQGRSIERTFLKTPLKYARVSSRFNPRRMHPILHVRRGHFGVDYAAPTGTPIWAAAPGKIVFRGRRGGAGNCVILTHENGYQTTYMHMSRFQKAQAVGKRVRAKEVIGYVGMTGLASGPHLHFSVKHRGRHVDPLKIKMTRGAGVKKEERAAFERHMAEAVTRLASVPPGPGATAASGAPAPSASP
jgi:murein DD-endopeptidase MepM/ murein hydrolase activator NlpD